MQHEILEAPVRVYNFQVEDYHTYYVTNTGILVHNKCGDTGSYNKLKAANKGSGNEVHHIIEKRFLKSTKYSSQGQMQSIVLTKADHRYYTNLWRQILPYGKTYSTAEIIAAVRRIYSSNKALLDLALQAF